MVHKSSAADSWTRRMTDLPRSFQDMGRAATKPLWARDVVLDLAKAACAALLFVSPWMLAFTSAPAWNLWIVGYLMLTCCLAELLAEADWEAQTNFCLGAWVLCAPWTLGFAAESVASLVHVAGGSCIFILSAVELLSGRRNPPWRFGPSSARRAVFLPSIAVLPERHESTSCCFPLRTKWAAARKRIARAGSRTAVHLRRSSDAAVVTWTPRHRQTGRTPPISGDAGDGLRRSDRDHHRVASFASSIYGPHQRSDEPRPSWPAVAQPSRLRR
jgi:hypothetical protein